MSKVRRIIRRRRLRREKSQTGFQLILRWVGTLFLIFVGLNILGLITGIGSLISAYAYYAQQLPEPGEITRVEEDFQTTKIYDRTGEHLIYEVIDPLGGDRTWVVINEIPVHLRNATIAIEDKTFYENPGYDAEGILRALYNNLSGGEIQGGSSITQQLVKNVLIEPEERTVISYDRKIKELILAVRISDEYSKDQILEWYMNTNFYGNLAYGVEAAAKIYYGKSVNELTLAESSMLAPIPQSPALNPIDNFDEAKSRQKVVLNEMVAQGLISQIEADIAYDSELEIKSLEQRFDILAPHFSLEARKQLEELVGPTLVYRGGLVVYTTLDYDLYLQTECAARSHIVRLSGQSFATVIPASDGSDCLAARYLHTIATEDRDWDHQVRNASVVILNVPTGEVLTMVGSLDYNDLTIDGNFNVATAERQPGSAIKPLTYLTAFEQGYTPATMTLDVRTAFDNQSNQPYVPENFDRQFHGPVSIRTALANSYNVPAVQVLEWVGIDNLIRISHAMGITSLDRGLDQYGLSLTLGGGEVSLYDLTYAYSVFAAEGRMNGTPTPEDQRRPGFRTLDPTFLLRVEDQAGNILWEYGQQNTFQTIPVAQPSLTYLITDILSDDVARRPSVGAESALLLSRPAAVKTGTTNDFRDNWAVGYTPQIAVGVWAGNTDNTAMVEMPAIVGAAPIWKAVMEYAHLDRPVVEWESPADITTMTVCTPSGLLPTPYCPIQQEIFKQGTEPNSFDNMYLPFRINTQTGLLATVYTPEHLIEQKIFQVFPAQAADWARESGILAPPNEYDTLYAPKVFGDVAITEPAPFEYLNGAVVVKGNALDSNFQYYRLDFGEGLQPSEWTQIGGTRFNTAYNSDLGIWDARALDGLYSLRLSVVSGDNSVSEFIIQVTVDNTSPAIEMVSPRDGQEFRLSDEFITIQPLVSDNISMDRVEFYLDDKLIAISTIPPFNERWIISTLGEHFIQLRAYDTVGNVTVSERIRIVVVGN